MKKMGVLGPLGTHSEAAAQYLSRLLPERPELLVYPDIFAVIQAVEDGEVDSCLVPVENSLEGAINITLDTLARSADLFVESELIDFCAKHMASESWPEQQVRAHMEALVPTLKHWK